MPPGGRKKGRPGTPTAGKRGKEPERPAAPEGEPGQEPGEQPLVPEGERWGGEKSKALVPARPKERGLVVDPLQAYMAEVSRHSLLTREEEHELAVRYQRTGEVKAAYRLVAANLRLVVKLAHEYHRNPLSLLDLIQEGNIGLMQAVKKFDPYRGVKLSSYAAWWIRAYILRYIMDNWKMVKLGTTEAQRKLFFKLRQEQERMLAQGFDPTPKLLAERLKVTEQDVVEMDQRLGHDEVSIDEPVGEDGKAARGERLLSSQSTPVDERLGNEQLKRVFREKLSEFARTLEDKERFIFERRLMADEPLTLQDIGDRYGVSRERARQIEAALIGRMREYMRQQMPDFDLTTPEG
ncbi:MAG: RNA polymerase factor sigma-32 [Myxococcales bacterium]|nr:RNA polymerase factor sigma-32 [Myxococcales bacterium]